MPITVTAGRSHSRSNSEVAGSPTSSTPARTPQARRRPAAFSREPGEARPFGGVGRHVVVPAGRRRGDRRARRPGSPASAPAPAPDRGPHRRPCPLCTGPSSARTVMSTPARPRSEYVRPGTPTVQLPASASTSTSARSSSTCASRKACEVGGADLLFALDQHLHVARRARRPCAARRDRGHVRDRARLVVGGTAPVEPAVALARVRTGRCSSGRRSRRAARRGARRAARWRVGPACIHSPTTYGCDRRRRASSRTSSSPASRSSSAVASALRVDVVARARRSALMLGMRTSSSSSRCARSRSSRGGGERGVGVHSAEVMAGSGRGGPQLLVPVGRLLARPAWRSRCRAIMLVERVAVARTRTDVADHRDPDAEREPVVHERRARPPVDRERLEPLHDRPGRDHHDRGADDERRVELLARVELAEPVTRGRAGGAGTSACRRASSG